MVAARGSMGRYKIKKYREASPRIAGSICIHTGITPLSDSVTAVNSVPETSAASTAWDEARWAPSWSWAPQERAINDRNTTPSAEMVLLISQLTVLVAPTAAVASVPSDPTMAVSMYCTAVCISCSSMVGHARLKMTAIMPGFRF